MGASRQRQSIMFRHGVTTAKRTKSEATATESARRNDNAKRNASEIAAEIVGTRTTRIAIETATVTEGTSPIIETETRTGKIGIATGAAIGIERKRERRKKSGKRRRKDRQRK